MLSVYNSERDPFSSFVTVNLDFLAKISHIFEEHREGRRVLCGFRLIRTTSGSSARTGEAEGSTGGGYSLRLGIYIMKKELD